MREFRIKVNNEKTYVVKAKDYNQAVKTLHSKLRDFDDTKKNINVVREFITNNGGKFSESKDADAILDFIYKKTGVKNADYGDVLYIVRNYTNVKVEDNTVTDYDLTNFLALKRSLELRIGEEIDFDKLEEYVNKLPKDKNGKKNINVKEVIKCCVKAKDNAVSDSISRYTGEDAIRTNGFVKIKEDGDWTSYKYNGSDFDNAVFKIHQYNPSLIAFVSNGNRTITVRNKYLNDADDTAQGEIEVLKSFGFDYKDGKWVKESNNNDIIVQPDYHYVSVIGPGDTEKHCKKYQYQSAGMLKKIIASNIKDSSIKDDLTMVEKYKKSIIYIDDNGYYYHTPIGGRGAKAYRDNTKDINIVKKRIDNDYSFLYDSSIKDVSYVSGKNLKIGQKIVEDGEVLEVVDIKETQRGVNNNYRDVTFKNVKTGATETVHFVNSTLARLNDDWSKGVSVTVKVTTESLINAAKEHKVLLGGRNDAPEKFIGRTSIRFTLPNKDNTAYANIDNSQSTIHYNMYDDEFTYKEFGGKKDFNKAKLTEGLKKLQDYVVSQLISAGIVVNQSKVEVGGSSKFNSTWRQAQSYNDESVKDADPVKVEKIIRKEKSALGVTYYIFQTKSSSGYTIYYQVTDKTYHGETTYSGGVIISFSLKSANDPLDHNLLMDKLKAKYGEKEGTKRYLRGENDSAINDRLSTSDANSLVEAYIDKYKYTHSNLPYVNKPKIKIFNSLEEFRDKFLSSYRGYSIYAGGLLNYNGYVVKLFTSAKDGKIESPSADNIFTIFPTTAIKDSSSIKNRISYDDLKRTINKVMEEGNDKDVVNILIGQLAELKKDYETDINNSKLDKEETKRHYGEYKRLVNNYKNSQISKEYTRAVNSFLSAIKDSNNIKNRKSYTIKVGDKQYKVFAESESEAVDKYIKSKKQ